MARMGERRSYWGRRWKGRQASEKIATKQNSERAKLFVWKRHGVTCLVLLLGWERRRVITTCCLQGHWACLRSGENPLPWGRTLEVASQGIWLGLDVWISNLGVVKGFVQIDYHCRAYVSIEIFARKRSRISPNYRLHSAEVILCTMIFPALFAWPCPEFFAGVCHSLSP